MQKAIDILKYPIPERWLSSYKSALRWWWFLVYTIKRLEKWEGCSNLIARMVTHFLQSCLLVIQLHVNLKFSNSRVGVRSLLRCFLLFALFKSCALSLVFCSITPLKQTTINWLQSIFYTCSNSSAPACCTFTLNRSYNVKMLLIFLACSCFKLFLQERGLQLLPPPPTFTLKMCNHFVLSFYKI